MKIRHSANKAMKHTNLIISYIYSLSTTNLPLPPQQNTSKQTANAFLYTVSDLQPFWAAMICTVLSWHTGNMHEQRQSMLPCTYFLYLVDSTKSTGCFQSVLLNPIMTTNFRKKCYLLFGKFEVAYMSVICFALVRLWQVSFLLTLLHCWIY